MSNQCGSGTYLRGAAKAIAVYDAASNCVTSD